MRNDYFRQQADAGPRVRNANEEHQASISPMERMALFVSQRVGTPGFFLLIIAWTAGWILWNCFAPPALRMDAGREFAVWILISNIIQIALLPLLMVAQNLQSRHDESRAENEYAIAMKSEREIADLQQQLQTIQANTDAIMTHLGISEEARRQRERAKDLTEEQFSQHSVDLAEESLRRMLDTHQQVLDRFSSAKGPVDVG